MRYLITMLVVISTFFAGCPETPAPATPVDFQVHVTEFDSVDFEPFTIASPFGFTTVLCHGDICTPGGNVATLEQLPDGDWEVAPINTGISTTWTSVQFHHL